MSDDFANSAPLPPPPMPAVEPAPIPVAALAYSTPVIHARPGILTAVGVISIVIASISGLVSLGSGCQSFFMMRMARTAPTMASTFSVTTATASSSPAVSPPAAAQIQAGPNGLNPDDRSVAIDALESLQPLSDAQKHQLDIFLAEHGDDVFPTAGAKLTGAQVKAIVTSSSSNPASDTNDSANVSFVTTRGTFAVYPDKVEFRRPGATDTVTTGDAAAAANANPAPSNPFGYRPLTAAEVQQTLTTIRQHPGVTLNAAQITTLTQQLQNPQQQLVQGPSVNSPILNVTQLPNGDVWVQFSSASTVTVSQAGQVTATWNPMTAAPTMFRISPWIMLGVAGEAVIGIGLAVLLMIAGIQVMRQAAWGRRLHLIWAWVKIPTAIAGWSLTILMYYRIQQPMMAGMVPPGSSTGLSMGYILFGVVSVVVACIYPVALLILFRTRSMRAYYNVVQM